MKLFACDGCGQPLHFESDACESCERRIGFDPADLDLHALERAGAAWRTRRGAAVRACANAAHDACNWLVPAESPHAYCPACRYNRTVPDLASPWNRDRWRRIEEAKRRLLYTLLRLGLPPVPRAEAPGGLAFDFLADPAEVSAVGPPVMTGHLDGIVTVNIAEADDVERERRRQVFGEHYRTVLGHFRHEIGHYYWTVLVGDDPSGGALPAFRAVFGDERRDYGAALAAYYARGPAPDWEDDHVSAYASSHPWEDFAETFAHLLHIVDTLETAGAFGLRVGPPRRSGSLATSAGIDFDPHRAPGIGPLIEAWLPLTAAVNAMNRSMGQPDLYPFRLTPAVIGKLAFVHGRILAHGRPVAEPATPMAVAADPDLGRELAPGLGRELVPDVGREPLPDHGRDTLRAVIAGLRYPVAPPRGDPGR